MNPADVRRRADAWPYDPHAARDKETYNPAAEDLGGRPARRPLSPVMCLRWAIATALFTASALVFLLLFLRIPVIERLVTPGGVGWASTSAAGAVPGTTHINTSTAAHDPYGGTTLAPSNYTVLQGYFRQDEDDFDPEGYDLLKDGFGLLDKSAERWHTFIRNITALNAAADAHTTYKVLFVARHGEGIHNVAEAHYGTPAWDCYWSMLEGNGDWVWGPDALLTSHGESQAHRANEAWKEQMAAGVPLPQTLYSSPLRRAASTLEITWGDILLDRGVRPVIKEMLRESIGLHTCDRRSSKTLLAHTYPRFVFEPSFTEHDPLWDATYQETELQEAVRLRMALGEIFATDASTFVGITAHSGVIHALFRAIGRRRFQVQTGGFVPVVLKATSHPTATFSPIVRGQSATAPACKDDPHPKPLPTATGR